jgi:hypothetical protein
MVKKERDLTVEGINHEISLLNDFPRTMGNPHQVFVHSIQERDKYIKKYASKYPIYISVYKFNLNGNLKDPDRSNPVIDKIFFNFNSESFISDLKKLHNWCLKRKVIHRCHFSGRGVHLFLFLNSMVKYTVKDVENLQIYLKNKLYLKFDDKMIGDTSRLFRVPNTYNFKVGCYCIPISNEIMNESLMIDTLKTLSTKKQFVDPWFGSKLLDL